jgi:hypothetical protein
MAQDAVTLKIKNGPRNSREAQNTDIIRRVPVYRKNSVGFGDTTVINLFELPGNVLVREVLVRVTTLSMRRELPPPRLRRLPCPMIPAQRPCSTRI